MSCIDQNMFLIQTQTLIKRAPDFKLLKVGQYWGWLFEDGMKIPSDIFPPTNLFVRYKGLKYK